MISCMGNEDCVVMCTEGLEQSRIAFRQHTRARAHTHGAHEENPWQHHLHLRREMLVWGGRCMSTWAVRGDFPIWGVWRSGFSKRIGLRENVTSLSTGVYIVEWCINPVIFSIFLWKWFCNGVTSFMIYWLSNTISQSNWMITSRVFFMLKNYFTCLTSL